MCKYMDNGFNVCNYNVFNQISMNIFDIEEIYENWCLFDIDEVIVSRRRVFIKFIV